jgi:hypothetical protein
MRIDDETTETAGNRLICEHPSYHHANVRVQKLGQNCQLARCIYHIGMDHLRNLF